MKSIYRILILAFVLFAFVSGCKKSSNSDDSSTILALALAQNGQGCSPKGLTITKGGSAVTGGSTAGYFYYYYVSLAGTTDTVTFSSTPSGGAGNVVSIGKSNILIAANNVTASANYDAFGAVAPYTNSSVTTSAGNFRCLVVQVPASGSSYSLSIN
ncbi:hypothetical protein EHO61_06345 [Leptospira fluminis]|uniref:Lipoprotein n=1 Tax=Leptospira fluminis TaxID=2484979 RepID=A0A4R9GQU9_9LEPT|nr:hypothetical protein [Leptospira fluminis]TGK20118.1 hypothetical protein EHO61_06345 [Leptospira fluminis]